MKSEDVAKNPTPQDQKRERDRRRIIDALRGRAPNESGSGCFLCKLIVEDFDLHGTLTGHPKDSNGHALFPQTGKAEHIKIELATMNLH